MGTLQVQAHETPSGMRGCVVCFSNVIVMRQPAGERARGALAFNFVQEKGLV